MSMVRLPGTGRSATGSARAYLDGDCLLLFETNGYREQYRRVELAEVQAIVVRRTRVAGLLAGLLAALAAAASLPALLAGAPNAWIGLAEILAIWSVSHLVRGPMCVTHVRTPIQQIRVAAWQRIRPTRRALRLLEERVAEVQGRLPPEEAAARWSEIPTRPQLPRWKRVEASPRNPGLALHATLVLLMLCEALMTTAQIILESPGLDVIAAFLYSFEIVVATAAVIRQRRSILPTGLRRWAGWTLGYLLVFMSLQQFLTFMSAAVGEPLLRRQGSVAAAAGAASLFVVGSILLLLHLLRRGHAGGTTPGGPGESS